MILLDTNVLIDIWEPDPMWGPWSSGQVRTLSNLHLMAINAVVYAEISVMFPTPDELDERLEELNTKVLDIPRRAAFLAGKAFVQYRRMGGKKGNVLPDFFIGAHAAVLGCEVLTRDTRRYSQYFPFVGLICP